MAETNRRTAKEIKDRMVVIMRMDARMMKMKLKLIRIFFKIEKSCRLRKLP